MPRTPASDQADLSSMLTVLRDLTRRVEGIAGKYQETPDSAVASDLFEAERALVTAGRVIERAVATLTDLAG